MRTKRIFLTAIVAVGIGLAGASLASAQSYPDRLIKIVVPYPPGGPADVAARLVTQPLSTKLGQSVIIENQPGGGGRTGAKFVAQDQWRAQRRAEIARTPGEHRQARPANEKHDAARVRQQACR